MDNILNEKTLCRILQGRLRCSLGDPALYIYEPTAEIIEESFDIYDQSYKEAYFRGVYLKKELVPILVENELWTPFDDREAKKIEKQIEDHKVKAFEFFYKTRDLANIKMVLRILEKDLLKCKSKKHTLDHISCEGVASFARSIWIISKTVYNIDKTPYDWSRHSISSLMDYYKGDNVYESSEAPDEKVIEDDDCLDGWFINQRREYDKQKKKRQAEDLIKNPKIANSQEVFLMAKDQEEANKIFDINDPLVRGIIRDRQNTIQNSERQIKFQELNDVRQDIAMDRVQAARDKFKGMR
jgi:hypothetical protein